MTERAPHRIWFLDSVRYWTVLAVIASHVGMSQMSFRFGWPVEDPRQLSAADWLVLVTDSFIMPVLFFVAGFFAIPSLTPKGPVRFLWAKFRRLMIPGAFVVVFLNPLYRYLYYCTHGFSQKIPEMSYWEYWPRFFDGALRLSVWAPGTPWPVEFEMVHIWFVTVLFLFFLLTAAVAVISPGITTRRTNCQTGSSAIRSRILQLAVATVAGWLGSFTIAACGLSAWVTVGALLNFPSTEMPFHLAYYCIGIVAYRCQWFSSPDGLGHVLGWLLPCLVLSPVLCYLSNVETANPALGATIGFQAGQRLCRAFLCMGFLGLLISVAARYANRPSTFRQHMATNSYRTYLLHVTVVILVQFVLYQWTSLPGIVVMLTGIALSLLGSHLVSVLVGEALTRASRYPPSKGAAAPPILSAGDLSR